MEDQQLRIVVNDLSSQLSQRSLELAVARSEAAILRERLEQSEQKKVANVQKEAEVIVNHTDE